MDNSELLGLRRNLDRFVRRFDGCIKTRPSRKHLRTYVRGQVSNLPRKNCEAIALQAGMAPRTLTEFLEIHRWEEQKMRVRVQEIVMKDHPHEEAIAVIDESGMPKKGDKTVGVQRQYCGATGKIDNCVMTVSLGYVAGDFHAIIDTDLYLPEKSWHNNRQRCREAKIPDSVVYRPKWKIALEELTRAIGNGVRFRYLTADEAYGGCAAFRNTVASLGLIYMVEVPTTTCGWTKKPSPTEGKRSQGPGRSEAAVHLAVGAPAARRVDRLWRRGGPHWEMFHIKDTEKGPLVWEIRATRFFASEDGLPGNEGWLIVARNVLDGEVKYFLANPPKEFPIEKLLHIGFSRWHIERLFEDSKDQVGLDQFQVHQYRPVIRHFIVSMVSLLFLSKEATRLRGKKTVLERTPSPYGCGITTGPYSSQEGGSPATDNCRQEDRIPPGRSRSGRAFASQKPPPSSKTKGHLCLQVA